MPEAPVHKPSPPTCGQCKETHHCGKSNSTGSCTECHCPKCMAAAADARLAAQNK